MAFLHFFFFFFFFFFFSFTLILTTTTTTSSSAGVLHPQPQATSTTTSDQFLTPHNQARRAVGVGPLRWAQNLTLLATQITNAQQKARRCGFANLNSSPYGANQAWASYPMGPAEAVGSWVSQGKYYNHTNNTCAEGKQCGTYTQVVWRKSLEIGCAQVTCAGQGTLTVCMYNPHGNVQGQFPY